MPTGMTPVSCAVHALMDASAYHEEQRLKPEDPDA
jgi:hypothetical protein